MYFLRFKGLAPPYSLIYKMCNPPTKYLSMVFPFPKNVKAYKSYKNLKYFVSVQFEVLL